MIFLLLLGLDQYLKYLSIHHAFDITEFPFFHLTLAKNPGVSLGFLGETSWIIIITIQAALLVWISLLKPPKLVKALIFAGAISNIIDRLYYGLVIDYIHFRAGSWQWPAIVNLADIYIVIAILIWLMRKSR